MVPLLVLVILCSITCETTLLSSREIYYTKLINDFQIPRSFSSKRLLAKKFQDGSIIYQSLLTNNVKQQYSQISIKTNTMLYALALETPGNNELKSNFIYSQHPFITGNIIQHMGTLNKNFELNTNSDPATGDMEVLVLHQKQRRWKRSGIVDRIKATGNKVHEQLKSIIKRRGSGSDKKVIHIPALFIDEEADGFQNVFYEEMITVALCLTSQPELDRHEMIDEYEAVLCNKKGFGNILRESQSSRKRRSSSRNIRSSDKEDDYHFHEADSANWNMKNKSTYDILWATTGSNSSTTTAHPILTDDYVYDYEYEVPEDELSNRTGWESGDKVEDPTELDYMSWPKFLLPHQTDDDHLRQKYHNHSLQKPIESFMAELGITGNDRPELDRKMFALNDSTYLAFYYDFTMKLTPYDMKPLLANFFQNRKKVLSQFEPPLSSDSLRKLLILFTIDIHHVNCFNRHIRFYGYMFKKPSSVNGDEITNGARLARGIVMRALELIRHVPEYNRHKELMLRFLIAALKERGSLSKTLRSLVGENDYTELYEVSTYLEHLLKNGIHPDEKDQDLFVQETRFYSHHFMNTLTL